MYKHTDGVCGVDRAACFCYEHGIYFILLVKVPCIYEVSAMSTFTLRASFD